MTYIPVLNALQLMLNNSNVWGEVSQIMTLLAISNFSVAHQFFQKIWYVVHDQFISVCVGQIILLNSTLVHL